VRLDVSHAQIGERAQHGRVTDRCGGLILGAPIGGQQPVVGLDDLGSEQPFEELLDIPDWRLGRRVGGAHRLLGARRIRRADLGRRQTGLRAGGRSVRIFQNEIHCRRRARPN